MVVRHDDSAGLPHSRPFPFRFSCLTSICGGNILCSGSAVPIPSLAGEKAVQREKQIPIFQIGGYPQRTSRTTEKIAERNDAPRRTVVAVLHQLLQMTRQPSLTVWIAKVNCEP
jgi:hypothetical protein